MRRVENGDIGGGKVPERPRAEGGYALLPAKEVRKRLGVPADQLYLMVAQGRLLTVLENDKIMFPDVQFSQTGSVLPGVEQVLNGFRAYGQERGMQPLPHDIAEVLSTQVGDKTIMEAAAEHPSEVVMRSAQASLRMVEERNAKGLLALSRTATEDPHIHELAVQALHGQIADLAGVPVELRRENESNKKALAKYNSFAGPVPYELLDEGAVMKKLGKGKGALEAMIRRHQLLAYETPDGWVFPEKQFVPVIPGKKAMRVVPGLDRVLLRLLDDPKRTEEGVLQLPRWAVGQALHTVTSRPIIPGMSMIDALRAEQQADVMVAIPDDAFFDMQSVAKTAEQKMPMDGTPADPFEVRAAMRDDIEAARTDVMEAGQHASEAGMGEEVALRVSMQVAFPVNPESVVRGDEASPISVRTQRNGSHGDKITYIEFKPDRVGDARWGAFDFTPSHAIRIQGGQWEATFAVRDDGVIVRRSVYLGDHDAEVSPHVTRELDASEVAALLRYTIAPNVHHESRETAMHFDTGERGELWNGWRVIPESSPDARDEILISDEPGAGEEGGFTVYRHRSSTTTTDSRATAAMAGNGGEYYDTDDSRDTRSNTGKGDSR